MPTGRVRNETRQAWLVDPQRRGAADPGGFVLLVGEPANDNHELREFNGCWADCGTKPRERGSQSVINAREASCGPGRVDVNDVVAEKRVENCHHSIADRLEVFGVNGGQGPHVNSLEHRPDFGGIARAAKHRDLVAQGCEARAQLLDCFLDAARAGRTDRAQTEECDLHFRIHDSTKAKLRQAT